MNISDYRLLESHFDKIPPVRRAQAPRTKPGGEPPEYPTPIEIPDPTEIPSPVPGDAPTELPGPEQNPTPEIEPPKERLVCAAPILWREASEVSSRSNHVSINIQEVRSRRTTLIRFIRPD